MREALWLFPLVLMACDGPTLCDTHPENHPAVLVFDSSTAGDVQLPAGGVAGFRLEGDAHGAEGRGAFILRDLTGASSVDVELFECSTLASTLTLNGAVADLEVNQPFDLACSANCEVCVSIGNPGAGAVEVSFVVQIDLVEELECGEEADHPGASSAPVEPLSSASIAL